MKGFNYINREYVNPVDLAVLDKTYSTLEQGHKDAIKAASELEISMANLDLNEAENAWRQQKINEIRQTIADNTTYGNAYGALDDLIKKSGDLAADQGMIGRLQAQKDYKEFTSNLDKRNDIPEAYKEFFKEKNKYYYEDQYDEQGNIIGGTKWVPTKTPVSTVPMDSLLTKALQWTAKAQGGNTITRWLDKDGNPTRDVSKAAIGEYFDQATSTWQRLSRDKLAKGVEAAIKSTPGARESLEQDYEISKWQYYKKGLKTDVIDKNGQLRTIEQFLQTKANPFYDATTFFNQTTTVKYGEAVSAIATLRNNSGGGTTSNNDPNTPGLFKGLPARFKNEYPTMAVAEIAKDKDALSKIFNDNNITNVDLNNIDIKAIEASIDSIRAVNPDAAFRATAKLQDLVRNQNYINDLLKDANEEEAAATRLSLAIDAMTDLPEDSYGLRDRYNSIVNSVFDGETESIRQYFVDDNVVDTFIGLLGGREKAAALGVKTGKNKDGKSYVELPEQYKNAYPAFAKAVQKAIDVHHNFFGEVWQDYKTTFNRNAGNNVMMVKDGVEDRLLGTILPIENTNADDIRKPESYGNNIPDAVYTNIIAFTKNLEKRKDEVIKGGELFVNTSYMEAPSPKIAEYIARSESDLQNSSKYIKLSDEERTKITNAIRHLGTTQYDMMLVSDRGAYEDIDSGKRMELAGMITASDDKDIDVVGMISPKTGRWAYGVTLKYKNNVWDGDKNATAKFMIESPELDNITESWNNRSTAIATHEIINRSAANMNIYLTDVENFGEDVPSISLKPQPTGTYDLVIAGESKGNISQAEAIHLKDLSVQMEQIKAACKTVPETLNINNIKAMIKNIATAYGTILGYNDNQILGLAHNLYNNLNR